MLCFLISAYSQLYGDFFFRVFQYIAFLDTFQSVINTSVFFILYAVSCSLRYNSESFFSFRTPRQSKYCYILNSSQYFCIICSRKKIKNVNKKVLLDWTRRLAFGKKTGYNFIFFSKFLKVSVTPVTITTI